MNNIGVNFQVAIFYLYLIEDGLQFLCLLLVVYIFYYKIQFFMTSSVLQRIYSVYGVIGILITALILEKLYILLACEYRNIIFFPFVHFKTASLLSEPKLPSKIFITNFPASGYNIPTTTKIN